MRTATGTTRVTAGADPGEPRRPLETLAAPDVYAALGSAPDGLAASDAASRLARVGPNELREGAGPSTLSRLAGQFAHPMALLLWAGALVALVADLPELSVAVVVVNLVNGVFGFWQEHKAERAMEALRRLLPVQARVLRDGREATVPAEELVPGDVLLLGEGDRISADARLVEHVELRVGQSALTGETMPVRKSSEPAPAAGGTRAEVVNLVFAGTTVSSGRGKAVVTATGMATEFGRIAGLTERTTAAPSPLQQELARVTRVVTVVAVGVGAVAGGTAMVLGLMSVTDALVFALGMIVAFVPEGLLPTVTLSLAMGTQRMAARNALVKRLSAVETLGGTTVICTDKTGTLTQDEMTVRELWTPAGSFEVSGTGYAPAGDVRQVRGTGASDDLRQMLVAAGLACNARVERRDDVWVVLGDPTEAAVEVVCAKAGIDLVAEGAAAPRVFELPFDSHRKRMSTLHAAHGGLALHVKGAPRELVARCVAARIDGRVVSLDETARREVLDANDAMSRRGLRVLAVAERVVDATEDRRAETLEVGLTLLGLVGMMDPPRPEVEEAVRTCRRAGIRTVMITGDYGLTAESIARRVGMVHGDGLRVVNGDELEVMDDDDLRAALEGEVLFARTSPEHKLRVVAALQELGNVVAVTGDGVNDAPALKKADIGVAMGRSGTEVAREAADMVLLDDNFASIVNAVEEGRAVFANLRRFTSYIFTSNTPEAVPFLLFAFSGGRIPLALPIMAILAIDLGTDLVPALALGAERPEPGIMERPPRRRAHHLVDRRLLVRSYCWLGAIQSVAVMVAFFALYWANGYRGLLDLPDEGNVYQQAVAVAFLAVVFTQVGNVFAQRAEVVSIRRVGLFSNRLVWVGVASELAIAALVVYLPFLQGIVGTAALPLSWWLWLVPLAPLLPIADEARKVLRRSPPEVT